MTDGANVRNTKGDSQTAFSLAVCAHPSVYTVLSHFCCHYPYLLYRNRCTASVFDSTQQPISQNHMRALRGGNMLSYYCTFCILPHDLEPCLPRSQPRLPACVTSPLSQLRCALSCVTFIPCFLFNYNPALGYSHHINSALYSNYKS